MLGAISPSNYIVLNHGTALSSPLGRLVVVTTMSLASGEDMPLPSPLPPSGRPGSHLPHSLSPSPATPGGRSSTAPG
eukprot:scaffold130984_cov72-Phaeocystis_antarctica.AAC.1